MENFVYALPAATSAEPSPWLVSLLGLGTVFVGLMSLILICTLMGLLFRTLANRKEKRSKEAATPAPTAVTTPVTEIPDRGAFVAAVSAALAEELGTDVAGLRILSIRRM